MPTLITAFANQTPPQVQDPMWTMLMIGGFFVIMWVVMIRPQQKRQRELADKIAAIKPGDRVVTNGGIHGLVITVPKEGPTLVIKVDENCKLTIDKIAVASVSSKDSKESK